MATQDDPAADPARNPGLDTAPCDLSRLSPAPIHPFLRAAASWPGRGGADRLRDFFPSIGRARVNGLFQTAGYPTEVAGRAWQAVHQPVPDDVWRDFPQYGSNMDRWYHERLLRGANAGRSPHIPGPRKSHRLSARLSIAGIGRSSRSPYTRYADDLLFSGGSEIARGPAASCPTSGRSLRTRDSWPTCAKHGSCGRAADSACRTDHQPSCQHSSRRIRSAQGDTLQLRAAGSGQSEHGGRAGVSFAPGRTRCLRRIRQSVARYTFAGSASPDQLARCLTFQQRPIVQRRSLKTCTMSTCFESRMTL